MKSAASILLLGDIIASREHFDPATWPIIHDGIDRLNDAFSDRLTIPLTIQSGDTIGTVTKDVTTAVQLAVRMPAHLAGMEARIVIARGPITFGLSTGQFKDLQGPVLWAASTTLESMKQEDRLARSLLDAPALDPALGAILDLVLAIMTGWNARQRRLFDLADHHRQADVARELEVTQQYVSKFLRRTDVRSVRHALSDLSTLLHDAPLRP